MKIGSMIFNRECRNEKRFFCAHFQEICLYERKNQMIFKLGNIQVPLTGAIADFDGTMMLSQSELALTNSMIQVNTPCRGFFFVGYLVLITSWWGRSEKNKNNNNKTVLHGV